MRAHKCVRALTKQLHDAASFLKNYQLLVNKFPELYGTRRFTIATGPCLSQLNPIHTYTRCYVVSLMSFLTLSSNVHRSLQSRHVPSGFPTNILYAFLIIPKHATYPTYLILLDLITLTFVIFGEEYKTWSYFLHETLTFNDFMLLSIHTASMLVLLMIRDYNAQQEVDRN
jgi:hypothetical protein